MKKVFVVKRLIAFITSLLLVLSFAACAAENKSDDSLTQKQDTTSDNGSQGQNTESASSAENSWEIDKDPVDISFFIDVAGRDFQQNWGKDEVSKKWIEETGVNIKWETTPDSDHKKLNLLIAAGNLPDMMLLTTDYTSRRQLAQNDYIWALNKLAEEAGAPDFMDNFDNNIITNKRVDYDSMDFYAAPVFHTPEEGMNEPFVPKNLQSVIVIDKIYQDMGSPEVKSGEDYIALLEKVREKYPDMIPAQSYRMASPDLDGNPRIVEVLLQHAGLGEKYFEQDGGYIKYWQHENFMLVLKFANRLYNDNLIDKTEFTDDKTKLQSKVNNGTVFSEINEDADNLGTYNAQFHKVDPESNWIMIEPFTLNPQVEYEADSLMGGYGNREIVVSKKSKNAVRALRFLDYLYQPETQKMIIYGIEGVGHTMVDGQPVFTQEYLEDEQKVGRNNSLMGNFNYYMLRNNYWNPMAKYSIASDIEKGAMKTADKYYKDFSFYTGADVYSSNSDLTKIAAQIKQYYRNEIMQIITADSSEVEGLYENMISEMKNMGLDELNKHYTDFFKEKKEMLEKYGN